MKPQVEISSLLASFHSPKECYIDYGKRKCINSFSQIQTLQAIELACWAKHAYGEIVV